MRIRTHYLIAITLVASMLCIGQAVDAQARHDVEPARGLVDRLSDAIRRTVATRPLVSKRCPYASLPVVTPSASLCAVVVAAPLCPACLPIPPPVV